MKKNKLILGLGSTILSLALSACSGAAPKEADYITELQIFQSLDTVRVMQVTDLHWHAGTDMDRQVNYLTKLVELCDPDIIVSTGDNFLGGNMNDIDTLFAFFNNVKNARGKPTFST